MSGASFRSLTPLDAEAFVAHSRRHMLESGRGGEAIFAPEPTLSDAAHLARTRDNLSTLAGPAMGVEWPSKAIIWGLWDEGELRGHLELDRPQHPSEAHRALLGMGVERGYRGQGAGTELMHMGLAWARACPQTDWIDLRVFAHNEGAIRFYERFGFQKVGLTKDCLRVGGKSIDDWHMTLKV